jgi:L-threonylcarbamoyladenylate synthase
MHEPMSSGFEGRRIPLGKEPGAVLARVLPEMRRGGVVLLPTDTIYGLSCRWDSERARQRIQAMKGPGRLGLFVALVASKEMAFRYGETPQGASLRFLEEQWPGPLTAVLRARPGLVPDFCLGPDGTVAFRWPRNNFLEALIGDLGIPVVSTSANRTGDDHVMTASAAWDLFGAGVDLYVDAGALLRPPSTLVDLTEAQPKLLRLGAVHPGGPSPETGGGA